MRTSRLLDGSRRDCCSRQSRPGARSAAGSQPPETPPVRCLGRRLGTVPKSSWLPPSPSTRIRVASTPSRRPFHRRQPAPSRKSSAQPDTSRATDLSRCSTMNGIPPPRSARRGRSRTATWPCAKHPSAWRHTNGRAARAAQDLRAAMRQPRPKVTDIRPFGRRARRNAGLGLDWNKGPSRFNARVASWILPVSTPAQVHSGSGAPLPRIHAAGGRVRPIGRARRALLESDRTLRPEAYRLSSTWARLASIVTDATNSPGSTGLARCISKPLRNALVRSSERANAVNAVAGTCERRRSSIDDPLDQLEAVHPRHA